MGAEAVLDPVRGDRGGQHDACRPEGASDLCRGDGGGAGGDAVVDDDDRTPGDVDARTVAAEPRGPALELGALGRLHGRHLGGAGADGGDDVVVEDPHIALADRPHAELLVARRSQFAHDDHVERGVECGGDLGGDRDAAPWQPEDDDVPVTEVVERGGEPAPGIDTIGEPHRAHRAMPTFWLSTVSPPIRLSSVSDSETDDNQMSGQAGA